MKKILSVLFLGVICLFIVGSSLNIKQALGVTEENVVEDISEKLIRFHVLANSDSDIDQDLKLRVKDEVLKYISPIVLPQGEYEAYRILIGEGKGQNWWCVMFPPLCFIDVTKGQVAYDETEKKMKDVLSEEEFKSVNKKENNVNFEFKVIDLFK